MKISNAKARMGISGGVREVSFFRAIARFSGVRGGFDDEAESPAAEDKSPAEDKSGAGKE